ncbi:hypothetical protein B4144_3423 [Bacillus atrophaeus]|nr:hypothetical protein B4144_3423 [Bacillus atrophaeus]
MCRAGEDIETPTFFSNDLSANQKFLLDQKSLLCSCTEE